MRIAYVCGDPGVPVFGSKGCSIHVQEICRALQNRGATVDLICARTGGDAPSDLSDCRVHELALPHCDDLRQREFEQYVWNERCRQALDDLGKVDLVYERYSIWNAAAMQWARTLGIPSVLEVNAPLIEEQQRHRGLIAFEQATKMTSACFRAAGAVYAVSGEIVPYCERFVGLRRPVHVIPNGVNVSRFSPDQTAEIPFDGVTFGFIGSLKPWHGVELLLEAFSLLCNAQEMTRNQGLEVPDIRLLIVGDGPQADVIQEQLRFRPKVRDHVVLTGAVSPDRVGAVLNSMDVAVAPYPEMEEFYFSPLKVFEYMASGRAVIAANTGQIPEIVRHRFNGLLYPPGDTVSLAGAMMRLLCNPRLRRSLAWQARESSLQHTWDHVVDAIFNLVSSDASLGAIPALVRRA